MCCFRCKVTALMVVLLGVSSVAYAGPFGVNLLQNPGFDADSGAPPASWTLASGSVSTVPTFSAPSLPNVLGSDSGWDSVTQAVDLLAAGFTQTELDNASNLAVVIDFKVFTTGPILPQSVDNRFDVWVNLNNVSGGNGSFIGFAASKGLVGERTIDVQTADAGFGGGSILAPGTPVNFRWTLTNIPSGLNTITPRLFMLNALTFMDDISVQVVELAPEPPLPADTFTITNVFFDDPNSTIGTGNFNQGQSFTPSVNDGNLVGPMPQVVALQDMTFWGSTIQDSQHDFQTPIYLNIYEGINPVDNPGPADGVGFIGSSSNAVIFKPGPLGFEFDNLELDSDTEYFALFSTSPIDGSPINQGVLFEGGSGKAAYDGGVFIHRGGIVTVDDMAFTATFAVPEPSGLVLALVAFAGVSASARRRRR